MTTIQEQLVAQVEREMAEWAAADRAIEDGLAARGRRQVQGGSTVYSFRLDPAEVEALERRAAALGIRPTVLARNLVRTGLSSGPGNAELSTAVDRLQAAVDAVRERVR